MKIFITGGTGFIGSRLVEKLVAGSHEVVLLVQDPVKFSDIEKKRAEAERTVVEYGEKGLDVVIVKPSRVYGPGKLTESNSLTEIINWLRSHG